MTPLGAEQRLPIAVLAAAFLFNLGQGVLRPSLPLYLQRAFAANYRMVTLIPVVFGGQIVGPLVMGFLADAIDLSAPFLFGAVLLTATAWQCRRQASAMSADATVEGRDS